MKRILCILLCLTAFPILTACEEYRPADAAVKPAADASLSSKITSANSKAREVFLRAEDYCTKCLIDGNKVNSGWHIVDLSYTVQSYKDDGTDLDNALRNALASADVSKQYAAVKISTDGAPMYAYWSTENYFSRMNMGDLDSISTEKADELYCASVPVVGGYPNEFKAGDVNTVELEIQGKQ